MWPVPEQLCFAISSSRTQHSFPVGSMSLQTISVPLGYTKSDLSPVKRYAAELLKLGKQVGRGRRHDTFWGVLFSLAVKRCVGQR